MKEQIESNENTKRIAFLAPSGFGKSTAIKILEPEYKLKNIKIATPLYELQKAFYERIGMDIGDTQDGELLKFFGTKIRKENPNFLLDEFLQELEIANKSGKYQLLTNDDCRIPDYPCLKDSGFVFVGIKGFTRLRGDHRPIDTKGSLEWQSKIPIDYEVNNQGSLAEYEKNIKQTIKKIMDIKDNSL